MTNGTNDTLERRLDTVIELLRHLLVLELAQPGVTQEKIGKHLHIAKSSVVEMLSGIKKERAKS